VLRRIRSHGWLIGLVLVVISGELLGHISALLVEAKPVVTLARRSLGQVAGQIPLMILPGNVERRVALHALIVDPIAPVASAPLRVVDAFQDTHRLVVGETLGDIAMRYGVGVPDLIWANGLQGGDALLLGQLLRIPRVPGIPYVVGEGETLAAIAVRFGVVPEAISAFGPNRLQDGHTPPVGTEIFVPGGSPPPSEALEAMGGPEALAARSAEPGGVILENETNLRDGPGTDYGQQVQLGRGRQVGLRARHGDWLKVAVAGAQGWVRADLLQIADGLIDVLPTTDDFPPPPPRWVWPTRGALTSGFGSRWGSFHNGVDIANQAWTPIVAARSGLVREAGWCSGYGYCVKIDHGGGVETIYGHMVTRPRVSAGEQVAVGQLIGNMGSTFDRAGGGYSTGVHLHFTVLINGRAVNPLKLLP
jgi:murein DD-endopeptidase MepM/ murein hydrolase activator NlpD